MEMPEGLGGWTLDEVAECLDGVKYGSDLYIKLWNMNSGLDECKRIENKKPLGGDGSNGTIEIPLEPDVDHFDNCMKQCWNQFNAEEQQVMVDGWATLQEQIS